MNYVLIKQSEKDGNVCFTVNAISLPIKNKSVTQKIPHPMGTDILVFDTLEDAKNAVARSGFAYILPNGEKGTNSTNSVKTPTYQENIYSINYEDIVMKTVLNKVKSTNSSVVASSLQALIGFNTEQTFNILFEKLGDDNDIIRKTAISGICAYGNILQDRIIDALKSPNWVVRNSALICISNLTENESMDMEKFIIPVVEACEDSNTIVQSCALTTLASVYKSYKINKNK